MVQGGCDKGFCISYYKLSYRRKLIRTLWTFLFGSIAVVALLYFRPVLWNWPLYVALAIVGLVLIFIGQAAYNYSKWQAEVRGESKV